MGILDSRYVGLSPEGSLVVEEADTVTPTVEGGHGRVSCLRYEAQAGLDVVVEVGHP